MVFHCSLSDINTLQVSRDLNIVAVLSNAVVWIVSTRPPTSKSSKHFNNALVIVPKYWYNRDLNVPQLFQFSSKVEVLILLFSFFQFYSVVHHNYYNYYSLEFFTLSDSKSLFKSPGLFSVFWPFSIMLCVWTVSIRPPSSKSSRPFNNSLVTVPKASITIGIIVTFIFHSFSIL